MNVRPTMGDIVKITLFNLLDEGKIYLNSSECMLKYDDFKRYVVDAELLKSEQAIKNKWDILVAQGIVRNDVRSVKRYHQGSFDFKEIDERHPNIMKAVMKKLYVDERNKIDEQYRQWGGKV